MRRNPWKTGLGAGFGTTALALAAAAFGSPRVRMRARRLGEELKRRLYIRSNATLAS